MLDVLFEIVYKYNLLFIAALLVFKLVLFISWNNKRKRIYHLLFSGDKIMDYIKSSKEMKILKAQNYLSLAIFFLLMFWIFLRLIITSA